MSLPTLTATGIVKFKEYKTVGQNNICSFVLNCSEKGKDGTWENFDIKATVWNKTADFVNQYFHDGDIAEVVGKLQTRVFEKQDGSKVRTTEFKFPSVNFPPKAFSNNQDARQRTGMNSPVATQTINKTVPIDTDEDSLPF